jgi:Domain of unknown function (DUF4439)
MNSPTALDAARTALLAEYAAAYGYGVVGAHVRGAAQAQAARALDWHQQQQSVLRTTLSAQGAEVPPPEPAYVLPFLVTGATSAARLAVILEDGTAAAYADLVGATESGARQAAALGLAQCAVRSAQWRGSSVPFPGLPERAAVPSG